MCSLGSDRNLIHFMCHLAVSMNVSRCRYTVEKKGTGPNFGGTEGCHVQKYGPNVRQPIGTGDTNMRLTSLMRIEQESIARLPNECGIFDLMWSKVSSTSEANVAKVKVAEAEARMTSRRAAKAAKDVKQAKVKRIMQTESTFGTCRR